ncbi:hypothetical protein [Janibacter sp. DB-40]|uniref:hypothetical protein n=1 Tax=Janibacter sp. DB-40 TaxID=3028808 RepID=UPI002405B3E2|nr:hypothetical protein [Janibacter sp. DB-40]
MRDESTNEMRRVAALPGGTPLSVAFYDRHRGAEALTSARIIQREGSWREACAAAGVAANKASRTSYRRKWSEADLLEWVRLYLAEDEKPSYGRFGQWLREQQDAPSANTVRNAFGGWSAVLEAASRD